MEVATCHNNSLLRDIQGRIIIRIQEEEAIIVIISSKGSKDHITIIKGTIQGIKGITKREVIRTMLILIPINSSIINNWNSKSLS
jgi:hypothetical protein